MLTSFLLKSSFPFFRLLVIIKAYIKLGENLNSFVKYFALFIFFSIYLLGAKVKHIYWKSGMDFKSYLKEHNISTNIIKSLDSEDAQLISEIGDRRKFYELIASNGVLLQSLIPIGEELELHLFLTKRGYKLEIIPIEYKKDTFIAHFSITKNLYKDIIKKTKNPKLADEFVKILNHSLDFKQLQKGDRVAVVYDQKMRLGRAIGTPDIKVAMVEKNGIKYYIFKFFDGKYYNENGEPLDNWYITKPLNTLRVTSPFTYRRLHPILHRYRAHLGVDLKAKRGTPIYAVADGVVTFAGDLGGYGNVVKIKHKDEYLSLYAHQSRIKVQKGDIVKRGDIIGYVGSTGRSTGAHLHFGLYQNKRAINPMPLVQFCCKSLSGEDRENFLKKKRAFMEIINNIFEKNMPSYILKSSNKDLVSPKMKEYYKKLGW